MSDLQEFGPDWDKIWSQVPPGSTVTLQQIQAALGAVCPHIYLATIASKDGTTLTYGGNNFSDALRKTARRMREVSGLPLEVEIPPELLRTPVRRTYLSLIHRFSDASHGEDGPWLRFYIDLTERLELAFPEEVGAEKRYWQRPGAEKDKTPVGKNIPIVVQVKPMSEQVGYRLEWDWQNKIWIQTDDPPTTQSEESNTPS